MNQVGRMNNIESIIRPPAAGIQELQSFELELGRRIPEPFRTHLLQWNVSKLRLSYYQEAGIEFRVNYFFGFSNNSYHDLSYNLQTYRGRIPNSLFPIASVDSGDLLCMDSASGDIYYWFHEEHDWGLSGNDTYPTRLPYFFLEFLNVLTTPAVPNEQEIRKTKEEGKIKKLSPFALKLINDDRAKNGLPPLTENELIE